jgi:hypothetical protein
MDSRHILERIEAGERNLEAQFGSLQVRVETEAADKLGLLLKRVVAETQTKPRQIEASLRKQTETVIDRLKYLDELKLIEVDGISKAVQIRSRKPAEDGFLEIILQNGNFVSLERRGAPLHISNKHFERVLQDLADIL